MKVSKRWPRYLWLTAAVISIYVFVSYLLLPATWARIEHQPGLSKRPMVTSTAQGIPGDAINVGLTGTKEQVVSAFHAAGWYPADPVTLRTSLEIIGSVLLDRSYKAAPVSPLYFDGRREDLAFEKLAGTSADRQQHVRLWLDLQSDTNGNPLGQVTHKIAPNIDEERDRLIAGLNGARMVRSIYQIRGVGPTLKGRNGEGDPYFTDGEIWVARLVAAGQKASAAAELLPAPALIKVKDKMFSWGSF